MHLKPEQQAILAAIIESCLVKYNDDPEFQKVFAERLGNTPLPTSDEINALRDRLLTKSGGYAIVNLTHGTYIGDEYCPYIMPGEEPCLYPSLESAARDIAWLMIGEEEQHTWKTLGIYQCSRILPDEKIKCLVEQHRLHLKSQM